MNLAAMVTPFPEAPALLFLRSNLLFLEIQSNFLALAGKRAKKKKIGSHNFKLGS